MQKVRISVRIDGEDFEKIQAAIKKAYPTLRSVSDVVRAALKEFLSKHEGVCVY
ncbi:MAG: ribbon-helix-helix domain-containing protein [Candidatus Bathyarchaeales archaeon]